MRTAFIQQLILEARSNPKIFLVVGDLGYSVVEPFANEFPERFLNAGVAEQNMTGLAAGLASEGYHVFTYSIANFPTLRCLEQFRNDVCYHNLPVTVVAVGGGLAYGNLGYSHHAVQDIACLRGLPNITLLSPADPGETRSCLRHLIANPGPSYLRIGKAGEPALHPEQALGTGLFRVSGNASARIGILATGSVLFEAMEAAKERADVAVYSLAQLAPLSDEALQPLWRHEKLITVEEHVRAGGLGELIAAARTESVQIKMLSVDGRLAGLVGSQQALRRAHGIDRLGIVSQL